METFSEITEKECVKERYYITHYMYITLHYREWYPPWQQKFDLCNITWLSQQ